MSDRTQEEGRTPYTEHDFDYTPNTNINTQYRINIDWQEKLLWETRRGNPIFDVEARGPAPKPDAPNITMFSSHRKPLPYGFTSEWYVGGKIDNFNPKATYSVATLLIGVEEGEVEVPVDSTGTFNYEVAYGAQYSENILADIQVKASVEVTLNGQSTIGRATTVVPFEFYVRAPTIDEATATPSTVEVGKTGDDVTVKYNVYNVGGPGKFSSGYVKVTKADGTVEKVQATGVDPTQTQVLPNSMFGEGENKLTIYAQSQYNGELSAESAKNITPVSGLIRPPAPKITIDEVINIEEGQPTLDVSGYVDAIVGTGLKSAVVKFAGKTYNCSLSVTNFEASVATDDLAVGDHPFSVEAVLVADLDSPVGTASGIVRVNTFVVPAPLVIQTPTVPVKVGEVSHILFGVNPVEGTTLNKVEVEFNGTTYPAIKDGDHYYVDLPTTGLGVGYHPYTLTVTAKRYNKISPPATFTSDVIIEGE